MGLFMPSTPGPNTPSFHAISCWPGIVGGFFNRLGGVSPAPFESLNVSYGVGDAPALVARNRQTIKTALGLSALISARQVHGDAILIVDSPVTADREHDGFDALITNQQGVGIMIQQADCQAVILHDPEHQVVANVHAGWRGSVANIVAQTVRRMTAVFGSEPSRLRAAISPSLGPCCAEFVNFRTELPAAFHPYQAATNHFDFWAITTMQLYDAGVEPDNISVAGICTRCDHEYFSYRRAAHTGRCATVVALG